MNKEKKEVIFDDGQKPDSSDEEWQEWMKNMERAMMPRNNEGLISPMIFQGKPPDRMLVPTVVPDENGCAPGMFFAEDFKNGRIPSYLDYTPGYEVNPESQYVEDRFLYENNLLARAMEDLRTFATLPKDEARKTKQPNPLLVTENDVQATTSGEGEFRIVAKEDGLFVYYHSGSQWLTNFTIGIEEYRFIHTRRADVRQEFFLWISCHGNLTQVVVPAGDLDNVSSIIKKKIPEATINPQIAKNVALLVNYVRDMVEGSRRVQVFSSVGFEKINGRWVYVHDGVSPAFPNVIYHTGYTIPHVAGLSQDTAYDHMLGLLQMSTRDEIMVPLVLLMHLGPLFELFRESGHAPRFVTFLNGITGSLKTSACLCLFRLFAEQDPDKPDASFYDTKTALERKMASTTSRVLLIDDYRPPVSAFDGKMKLESLEMVIRYIGDQTGKARSSPGLDVRVQDPPSCCCVITGEDTGGSQSSLLRCLILNIEKDDINGKVLKWYQDNPMILQTHMLYFVDWCGDHAEQIIQMIRESFEEMRDSFSSDITERRQVDTGVILLLTTRVLVEYGLAVGAVSPEAAEEFYRRFQLALHKALRQSESHGKQMDPVTMYLQAIFDLTTSGKISVACDAVSYDSKRDIGFAAGDFWWLRSRDVYLAVMRYWRELGITFPLSLLRMCEALDQAKLIHVSYENRNGSKKTLYSKRAPIEGRPRMLVVDICSARQYVDETTRT